MHMGKAMGAKRSVCPNKTNSISVPWSLGQTTVLSSEKKFTFSFSFCFLLRKCSFVILLSSVVFI